MRNGYCPTTVKTTAGPITLQRPKLRNTTERFASQLFGKGVTKTNALEALVIAGFVRGLSTRDVEGALTEALGESATVSRSTVSRICTEIKTQFQQWSARRLDDVSLDYLFLDGSISSTTPTPPPNRCWPPGASTPTANRYSSD
jgi:transposase-like protein